MKRAALLALVLLAPLPAHAGPDCAYVQGPPSPQAQQLIASARNETPFGLVLKLRALTEKEPGNAALWGWRAFAEQQTGETKSALESLGKTLDLNPCDDKARMRRAEIEQKLGMLREAYFDYSKLIERKPDDARAYQLRGDLLQSVAEFSAALSDFDAALAKGPPNDDLLLNRGGLMQELGRYREAIADYEKILGREPDNVDALAARGYSRFFLQDFVGAASDLASAAGVNDNAFVWRFLALARTGSASALADFQRDAAGHADWVKATAEHLAAPETDDNFLERYPRAELRCYLEFYIGEFALSKGDPTRAKRLFLEASDDCPKDPRETQGSLREYVGATEELKRMQ
ncbi:MAG: hypothetical protein KGM42_10995 [Hyphomicrobiales bacterium]|nr:hypothetical protein [Hyphomicrobiales bacterium]